MERVSLGATGITASAVGLGCGGGSRLGLRKGGSEAAAIEVVQRALDLGITFFDTAPTYGTEAVLGKALSGRRDEILLCSKVKFPFPTLAGRPRAALETAADAVFGTGFPSVDHVIRRSVEDSLRALRSDRVDILWVQSVMPERFDMVMKRALPTLDRLVDEGKIRAFGVTERFELDLEHKMLHAALAHPACLALMVGHNMLNFGARHGVLDAQPDHHGGTVCMFAVRWALQSAEHLNALVRQLKKSGEVAPDADPVADLARVFDTSPDMLDLSAIAYRFARHETGLNVVLTGTGSVEHLERNVAALNAEPLPPEALEIIERCFDGVHSVSGDPPPEGSA